MFAQTVDTPGVAKEDQMFVIGIAGKKRHGKDAVAKIIMNYAKEHGHVAVKRAMADPLKEECAKMIVEELASNSSCSFNLTTYYEQVLADMNSDETKEKYRLLLQWWGTEFKRSIDPDYWVKRLKVWLSVAKNYVDLVVIPDVRFVNEIETVKQLGGIVIRVERPQLVQCDTHASEKLLDDYKNWDSVIVNDGTLDELEQHVRAVCEEIWKL